MTSHDLAYNVVQLTLDNVSFERETDRREEATTLTNRLYLIIIYHNYYYYYGIGYNGNINNKIVSFYKRNKSGVFNDLT